MNKRELYTLLTTTSSEATKAERDFIVGRLMNAASIVWCVANKKKMHLSLSEPPEEIAWAFAHGEFVLLEANEEEITFLRVNRRSSRGNTASATQWTIPRAWVHYSMRSAGNVSRTAIRRAKNDLPEQEILRLKRELQKKVDKENRMAKTYRELEKEFLGLRQEIRREKKVLAAKERAYEERKSK